MTAAAQDILPCPFCGGEAYVNYSHSGEIFGVRCKKWIGSAGSLECLGAGAYAKNEAVAIAAWNRRAPLHGEVAALDIASNIINAVEGCTCDACLDKASEIIRAAIRSPSQPTGE